MSEGGWFRRLLHRSRPAALGLRRRILLTITLGAIALSLFLAVTTYGLTQNNLVRQAEDAAVTTSLRNAQGVFRDLRSKPSTAQPAVESLTNIGVTRYLIRYQEEWIGGVTPYVDANLPEQIVDRVAITSRNPRNRTSLSAGIFPASVRTSSSAPSKSKNRHSTVSESHCSLHR